MFGKVTLALVTMAVSSTQGAFVTTAPSVAHSSGTTLGLHGMVAPSASLNHRRTNNKNAFQRNMSTTDDEVAKLLAAAKKAREEADDLSRAMGKDPDAAPKGRGEAIIKDVSPEDLSKMASSIDFEAGDADTQAKALTALVESGDFTLYKSVASSSETMLRTFPVSLNMLEQRTGLTGEILGVTDSSEKDVSLDDIKDLTVGVVLGSSALAIASLVLLPENVGATACYFFALIPVMFVGIGSTSPGLIAGAIVSTRGSADDVSDRLDRICRHEAGHFLCGYLCGLPIESYSVSEDMGVPLVEFGLPSINDDSNTSPKQRELTREEIAALSIVAMSGSVAEALALGQAFGGEEDLRNLSALFRKSKEFLGATKQQDLTRWGSLQAYNLIKANLPKYESLVQAFKDKKSVAECIALIEQRS